MIARLRGTVEEKTPERVIVDVQGVGYEVKVPLSTYGSLPPVGEQVCLLVHTHVREDTLSLFGFATRRERLLFERIIGVSGIGPRLAIVLLSGLPPEDLAEAIREGNVAGLCRIPGVGRKTAERLVVELRDKIEGSGGEPARRKSASLGAPGHGEGIFADVLSALINLGYAPRDAEKAASDARRSLKSSAPREEGIPSESFEALLKAALRSASAVR